LLQGGGRPFATGGDHCGYPRPPPVANQQPLISAPPRSPLDSSFSRHLPHIKGHLSLQIQPRSTPPWGIAAWKPEMRKRTTTVLRPMPACPGAQILIRPRAYQGGFLGSCGAPSGCGIPLIRHVSVCYRGGARPKPETDPAVWWVPGHPEA
jgi:hypothetical protein